MKITYRPHLMNANKPFEFTPVEGNEVRSTLLLILLQNFLALENHSLAPYKSRMEFLDDKNRNKVRADHQRLVDNVNHHTYGDLFDQSPESLKDCSDAMKFGLRLTYYPQIPCKPFYFPVRDLNEAIEFFKLIIRYDEYLLTECDSMRVEYCNTFDLEMFDKEDNDWCSWYLETDEEYFDDFQEYYHHVSDSQAA